MSPELVEVGTNAEPICPWLIEAVCLLERHRSGAAIIQADLERFYTKWDFKSPEEARREIDGYE